MSQISLAYTQRIDRVIDFLGDHLDQAHRLEALAKVACFSPYHFHRIFGAVTGETVNGFTNRLRVEKAARLLLRTALSATEVALECGFSSSAAFSRSFTKAYSLSPTAYRKSGDIKNSKICQDLFPRHDYYLPMTEAAKAAAFPLEIKTFPGWTVAYIRVFNAFAGSRVLDALRRLIDWAKSQDIYASGTLFGMSIDDPAVTPKHLFRYDVCLATNAPCHCPEGISKRKIPSRAYAVTRIDGDLRLVATAWDYLFRGWLISSDFEPEHAPAFELYLDKDKALDWSTFKLDLCLPVKPLPKRAKYR